VESVNALIAFVLVVVTWVLVVQLLGWSTHRHRWRR